MDFLKIFFQGLQDIKPWTFKDFLKVLKAVKRGSKEQKQWIFLNSFCEGLKLELFPDFC